VYFALSRQKYLTLEQEDVKKKPKGPNESTANHNLKTQALAHLSPCFSDGDCFI
jgi:hypothetical protein